MILCHYCRKRPASSERPVGNEYVYVCENKLCLKTYHKETTPKLQPQPPAEQQQMLF